MRQKSARGSSRGASDRARTSHSSSAARGTLHHVARSGRAVARPRMRIANSRENRTEARGTRGATARPMELSEKNKLALLRFAASFLWADFEVDERERTFFDALARELGFTHHDPRVNAVLAIPPTPDQVDPMRVDPTLASTLRTVALNAIAADGRVDAGEMQMFYLLDELLPREPRPNETSDYQPS